MVVAYISAKPKNHPHHCMFKVREISLLERCVETAKKSKLFDRIVVATGDSELVHLTRLFHAEPWVLKPIEENGQVEKGLGRFFVENPDVKKVVVLFPTHPLLRASDIEGGLGLIGKEGCDSSFGAYIWDWKPTWTDKFKPKFNLHKRPKPENMAVHYVDSGSFYAITREAFAKTGLRHGSVCRPFVMPLGRSISLEDKANLDVVKRMLL